MGEAVRSWAGSEAECADRDRDKGGITGAADGDLGAVPAPEASERRSRSVQRLGVDSGSRASSRVRSSSRLAWADTTAASYSSPIPVESDDT